MADIDLAGADGRTRQIVRALTVSTSSGALATLPIGRLASPVTCAKTSGSSDLTVASSTGVISSTAGIAAAASEQIVGTMTGADGCIITFDYTLTGESGEVTLTDATGTFTLAENASAGDVFGAIGNLQGATPSLLDDDGGRVAISGNNIVRGATALDFETHPSGSFTLRKVLTGAIGTPHDTVLNYTVTDVAEGGGGSSFRLLEDGTSFRLLEDGTSKRLLE